MPDYKHEYTKAEQQPIPKVEHWRPGPPKNFTVKPHYVSPPILEDPRVTRLKMLAKRKKMEKRKRKMMKKLKDKGIKMPWGEHEHKDGDEDHGITEDGFFREKKKDNGWSGVEGPKITKAKPVPKPKIIKIPNLS